MQNFIYKKDIFIYEKCNSIPDKLCEYIIEIFNNYKISNLEEYIYTNIEYTKITKCLSNELLRNINEYYKRINIIKNFKILNIRIQKFFFYILHNNNNGNNGNNENNFNIINRFSEDKFKLLIYIWFLNDYDGEITFWNEYKVKPKAGKLLLFPVSWCFPYQELIHLHANKYIIYGYVYS